MGSDINAATSKRYNNSNNNKQTSKKQGTQAYKQNGNNIGISDQHANLISEGALSQLINSHINENDTAMVMSNQQNSVGQNDSFENTNLAFWSRKQNEYKANLQGKAASGEQKQSVLTNQARIMTHLMSLDECDMATPVDSA